VATLIQSRREEVLLAAVCALTSGEQEQPGRFATKLLDHSVVIARNAMRTYRLCDYDVCAKCPMHKFSSEGQILA